MTTTISLALVIDASPAAVWDAVEDIATHVDWMRDAERIVFQGAQRSGVGTQLECLTRVGPLHTNDLLRVVEWEPPRVMALEHVGAVTGVGRFLLSPVDEGARTEFVWTERLTYPWWLGGVIGEWVSRPILARIWRANLVALREIIER